MASRLGRSPGSLCFGGGGVFVDLGQLIPSRVEHRVEGGRVGAGDRPAMGLVRMSICHPLAAFSPYQMAK